VLYRLIPVLRLALAGACALGGACKAKGGGAPADPDAPPSAGAEAAPRARRGKALRIAYSDWPGWTAFEVGLQKGWFEEARVEVELSWFDYLPSLDAFASGKVDAVTCTNGDALVTGANGAKGKIVLVTDYSNGNDQVIGRPGIESLRELKGQKIGLELTLVEHLLLLKGLEKVGMRPDDVALVNVPTSETPQALASGQVSAIAAWYPIAGQARKAVPGATALVTSADFPGLIYDTLTVNPTSLARRKEDWAKVVKVWYRISDYVRDPKTQAQAVAIMAAKVGVSPDEYAQAMPGTYFLSLEEAKKRYVKGPGLDSLHGSTAVADRFNLDNKVYKTPQVVDDYVYPDLVQGL
jgi:NitT/TauT family transport system substrate-binding protein